MPKILILYRRSDSDAITGHIFDRLADHYGRPSVFRDVDNIPLGVDFRDYIKTILDECDIVLVVVGSRWIGRTRGQSRIHDPADPVRIEVEIALQKGVPVIPILVGGIRMPKGEQLPDSLKAFAYRNGQRVDTGQDFDHHMDRLIRALDGILAKVRPLAAPEALLGPEVAEAPPSNAEAATRFAERLSVGEAWRRQVPLSALAEWKPPENRADPVEILIGLGKARIQELLPVRHARMKTNPFAFLRGAVAIMAADLGSGPSTSLRTQVCGDCHLANFGCYATPEGTPVFDIVDFDETLPAPFEWDLKRLTASLVVAGRVALMSERECQRLARAATLSYREHLAHLAGLPPLAAATSQIDLASAIAEIDSSKIRRRIEKRHAAVLEGETNHFGLVERKSGDWKIKDKPPLVRHLSHHELHAHQAFASYAETLQEDRRVLLQRYHRRDIAFKTVGVGSVGTFCAIGLFVSDVGSPLLLQIKEAQESILAPFAGASDYANHGQRVVIGQRMMQAATDIFLSWTQVVNGRHFYVRRLKDSSLANIGALLEAELPFYATLCGRTLARAHARAGDAAALSGYIGDDNEFDKAITEFAMSYSQQTERDFRVFLDAIETGRISAE